MNAEPGETVSDQKPLVTTEEDPRPVSDHKVREEYSREEVQKWRDEALAQHRRWMEVVKNRYGKE